MRVPRLALLAPLAAVALTLLAAPTRGQEPTWTLYRPTNPRLIAPESTFFTEPRFSFASSMASTPEESANPWLLLNRTFDDGAIPAGRSGGDGG